MRSALFVDFDNVFSGLARLGPAYAEAFARNPSRWMAWLTDTVAHPPGADAGGAKRRILVRRCYLNPEPFKRFRIGFSRAGFEIVDCPPMTAAGKTSTDIHMVLDIVDVLQAATHYDEFIVFSADADFTPVLRKLRREDRRTTIFAAGATSASYDASADLILDPEAFIRDGLGFDDDDVATNAEAPDLDSLVAQAEAVVWRTVDQADQPVPLPALTKALAVNVPALPATGWAGKGTFLALLKSLPLAPLRIDREQNVLLDPRRLGRPPGDTVPFAAPAAVASPTAEASADGAANAMATLERLIADEVAASSRPIAVARLAQRARARLPGIEADWLGHGSWKRLLEALRPDGVQIVWNQLAGYALDPARHTLDLSPPPEAGFGDAPAAPPAVAPLLEAAGLPVLPPGRYRVLLESLSLALEEKPFSLAAVTKFMRDHCQDHHAAVSREHCNTLVRSLLFNGFLPDSDEHGLEALATLVCGVVAAAAAREGLKVDDADRQALAAWAMAESVA